MEEKDDKHHDEDLVTSPAKRVKIDHDFNCKGDSHPVTQERRKGVAPVKQE